jgi:hypothetical protein
MPITPKRGSLFHAETHIGDACEVDLRDRLRHDRHAESRRYHVNDRRYLRCLLSKLGTEPGPLTACDDRIVQAGSDRRSRQPMEISAPAGDPFSCCAFKEDQSPQLAELDLRYTALNFPDTVPVLIPKRPPPPARKTRLQRNGPSLG